MSTENRLRDALEARASAVTPDPAAYAGVLARARRQRQRLWLATAGASAMAVVATIAVVTTTRGDGLAVVPITSGTPQPSATTEPAPTSTSAPAEEPQALSQDQFVALLPDGRAVVVSAETGQVTDTLATGLPYGGPGAAIELTPDRKAVYVSSPSGDAWNPSCEEERPMTRIDLTPTPRVVRLERGIDPQVSPNGRLLAYRSKCGGPATEQALVVRDLQTGMVKRIRNTEEFGQADNNEGPNIFTDHAWHHDGRQVWVTLDWESSPVLRLIDTTTDETLDDGERITLQHSPYQLEAYDDALVFLHLCCYPELDGQRSIVLRYPDGRETEQVVSPYSGNLRNPQVGPLGDLLWEQSDRLFRRRLNGDTVDLGPSTALARDW